MVTMRRTTTLAALALVTGLAGSALAQTDHSAHMAADAASHDSLEGSNTHGIDVAFELSWDAGSIPHWAAYSIIRQNAG